MNYHQYIASPQWSYKRATRLEIDNHQCVVCKHDGSDHRLEVHHLHYRSLGEEDTLHDLITVCSLCHPVLQNIELLHRPQRGIEPSFISTISTRMENSHGMASAEIQADFIGPTAYEKRADSRPSQQMVKSDKEDFIQESQNRHRL